MIDVPAQRTVTDDSQRCMRNVGDESCERPNEERDAFLGAEPAAIHESRMRRWTVRGRAFRCRNTERYDLRVDSRSGKLAFHPPARTEDAICPHEHSSNPGISRLIAYPVRKTDTSIVPARNSGVFQARGSTRKHSRPERADRFVVHHCDHDRRARERSEYRRREVIRELTHDCDVRFQCSHNGPQPTTGDRIRNLQECLCRWEIRSIDTMIARFAADLGLSARTCVRIASP